MKAADVWVPHAYTIRQNVERSYPYVKVFGSLFFIFILQLMQNILAQSGDTAIVWQATFVNI